ncbi:hypothetical protein ACFQ6Q_00025 [Streptomyces sp. NPDC056437]|uniref:hypothetical protein n=1 Tax=Streptomyces sp. NPDC056437 TaxID=3345816 RepID=UPI00369C9B6B
MTAPTDRPDELVVLDPQQAAHRYVEYGLHDLMNRVQRMVGIPEAAESLAADFERTRDRSAGAARCEYLADPAAANARIGAAIALARAELLTAQPGGPRTKELLDIAVARDSHALENGVAVRTLYMDSVRDDPVTREWATVMTSRGAHFRTLISPFQRCIIIDGREAFVSDHSGGPANAAWHVQHVAMVAWIKAVFEDSWRRGDVWNGDARTRDASTGTRTTPLQREILRDTAEGIEQRKTAARLRISPRKVTEEIRKLRELFHADTLPQLMYYWARSPERLIDDRPATTDAA